MPCRRSFSGIEYGKNGLALSLQQSPYPLGCQAGYLWTEIQGTDYAASMPRVASCRDNSRGQVSYYVRFRVPCA
jgi:hypothetical protein